MPQFNDLFDKWAANYDHTVYGSNHEYREVFANYQQILEQICSNIADKKSGITLELGLGTGNLSELLANNDFYVVGVEPSAQMRKMAAQKLHNVTILEGHFLSVPFFNKVDSIVSSYAFHHLTYEEKMDALVYLDSILNSGGKIVIADTMYSSPEYKAALIEQVKEQSATNLLHDLNTEFYEYLDDITAIFQRLHYSYQTVQMNKYVWIITAQKGGLHHD